MNCACSACLRCKTPSCEEEIVESMVVSGGFVRKNIGWLPLLLCCDKRK